MSTHAPVPDDGQEPMPVLFKDVLQVAGQVAARISNDEVDARLHRVLRRAGHHSPAGADCIPAADGGRQLVRYIEPCGVTRKSDVEDGGEETRAQRPPGSGPEPQPADGPEQAPRVGQPSATHGWALRRQVNRIDRLTDRRARLRRQARRLGREQLRHPDGGRRSYAQTMTDRDAQSAAIDADRALGSHKHERLPRWMRRIPPLVSILDFLLLLYFFAGITNVDWRNPVSINLIYAGVLAVMVTAVAYGFLAFTGYQLRRRKGNGGHTPLRDLDSLTRVSVALSGVAIAMLSLLMFVRMQSEILNALGSSAGITTVVAIAGALATVSLLANSLVIFVQAADGSEQTRRLETLGKATMRPMKRAARMRRRADKLDHVIARQIRRAERWTVRTGSRAKWPGISAGLDGIPPSDDWDWDWASAWATAARAGTEPEYREASSRTLLPGKGRSGYPPLSEPPGSAWRP